MRNEKSFFDSMEQDIMNADISETEKNKLMKNFLHLKGQKINLIITGATGCGKSSTINGLFHKEVAKVGNGVEPETMKLGNYKLNDVFRIWDTPGLGDGTVKDHIYKKKITNLLCRSYQLEGNVYGVIDMVLVIIEGANRDMGTTYTLLNEVIAPNIEGERILVVINQADVAMKGRHWNKDNMMPDIELTDFLEKQSYSIQRRVKEATGVNIPKPVYYSAEYGYNMKSVFDFIVDNIPARKRRLTM